jgi:hypothetical protein
MRRPALIALLASFLATLAVAQETGKDPVKRLGKTVVQYKDDKVQVVLGYRHANAHMDREWMLLDVCMSAIQSSPIEVAREDISLVVPGGGKINLASQKAVVTGLKDLNQTFREASITTDPLQGYFVGPVRQQGLAFFAPVDGGIVYDRVSVDRTILAEGYLFFHAPEGGFPKGRFALDIYNKWVDVELPFHLPADEAAERKKDDKTVPW